MLEKEVEYHGFYLQLQVDEQYLQQLVQQQFLVQYQDRLPAKPTDRPEATTEAADTIGFIKLL
jgi:hypothetical protein